MVLRRILGPVFVGIDFIKAQAVWDDPYMVEWPARSTDEPRRAVTGIAHGKLWTAFVMKQKSISATEFDRLFDESHDIWDYLDHSKVRRPNLEPKRVNVDFPLWMVRRLDAESSRLGVTRQSLIKTWIGDRLQQEENRQKET